MVEKDQTYKIEKFDSAFSTDEGSIGKDNSIWGGKNSKLNVLGLN